jgi:hypothetical protein
VFYIYLENRPLPSKSELKLGRESEEEAGEENFKVGRSGLVMLHP